MSSVSGGRPARRRLLQAIHKTERQGLRLHHLSQRVAPLGSSWGKCGRVPRGRPAIIRDIDAANHSQYAPVRVFGVTGEYAAFAGLCSCGSPWCIRCGAKIARHRAEELSRLIANVRAAAGEVYMLSCTVPHDQGDELAPMRAALSDAWRYAQQGHWSELKGRLGIVGTIRGDDEPTWGQHGWHPHFHVLLITERPLGAGDRQELTDYVYRRWAARIERHGYRAPSREHGVVLTVSRDDGYVVKLGLADELTSGLYKQPHNGRFSPMQILLQAEETGDTRFLKVYGEYRTAYHGRRKLTYSRGLRARYLPAVEVSDEEIAAADEIAQDASGVPFDRVFTADETELWKRGLADSADRQSELLAVARAKGESGVDLYLQYVALHARLADRLGLSRYAPITTLRSRLHDPPEDLERAA